MALRQTVTGIVYRGVCRLPDELLPPDGLLMRWVAEADAIERKNRAMNRALEELCSLFARGGITPVLQKGQGIAALYEQPLLRECGDIDFYFRTRKEAAAAVDLIKSQGIAVTPKADGSSVYRWRGIVVEHHPRLIDIANPGAWKYIAALEEREGYVLTRPVAGQAWEVCVPSPLLNLLLIDTHIMKHALGWGIGLRQLCDMARAVHRLGPDVDAAGLQAVCRSLGITRWSCLLYAFLTEWMGLPPEESFYATGRISARPLLRIVMEGGNFGQYLPGRGHGSSSVWRRKMHTAGVFVRRIRFSCSYVPAEAFWTFAGLLKGSLGM